MTTNASEARPRPHLFLGDRPRLEIPLTAGEPGSLPTWLVIALPGPTSKERPEGRFLADPRLPESEVVLAWSHALAVPRAVAVLTITVGDESWTLEQDVRHPERWLAQAHSDSKRHWS
jgi:hypothetical protein